MRRKSFSRRLSWRIIGIVSIILVVMLVVVGVVSSRIIAEEALRASQHILHGTISEIERPLGEVEIVTRTVAAHAVQYTTGKKPSDEAIQTLMLRTVEQSQLIDACSVIIPGKESNKTYYCFSDKDGKIHNGILDTNRPERKWIDAMVAGLSKSEKPVWSDPHRQMGHPDSRAITFCYPILHEGHLVTIVTADLSIEWMEQKVESLRPYKNSMTSILCSGGGVIGIKDTALLEQIRKSFAEDKELAALGEELKSGKDSLKRRLGKGREVSFVVYGPLHNGWMLSIVCQYRDVLARSTQMQANLFIIGFLGLIILFVLCRIIIYRLVRPITQLSQSTLKMAKGDFSAQLPEIKSQDEMKSLRDSFVYMQNSIADYIEELKTTTAANERMESELGVARNIQLGMLRTDFPPQLYENRPPL